MIILPKVLLSESICSVTEILVSWGLQRFVEFQYTWHIKGQKVSGKWTWNNHTS